MAKINILTKEIYNRISAGEVVERPASAVKELVENSLDAGATEIEIYVEKGGKQLIKVVDDGCGIEKDDMRSAFIPHATSKISSVEDLDKITTLGFRGEALASIASISKTEIISVTEGNEACKIVCDGGRIGTVEPAALQKGTEISVYNLFYNTPAREKFLKTDKGEETEITNCVTRFILGNPNVSFKYYTDGKLHLQSHGGGIEEAIAQVYGAKVLSQCFKIKTEITGIKIFGFIGNQNFFKPNRSYQNLFLNGRYIINNTVSSAINQAYSYYAMKRQYPFYVLFVDVPVDFVDVNVTPNKSDVRFVNNQTVFLALRDVISNVLDGNLRAADFLYSDKEEQKACINKMLNKEYANSTYAEGMKKRQEEVEFNSDEIKPIIQDGKVLIPVLNDPLIELTKKSKEMKELAFKKEMEKNAVEKLPFDNFNPEKDLSLQKFLGERVNKPQNFVVGEDNYIYGMQLAVPPQKPKKPEQLEFCLKNCVYKGNLFNTYLSYEINEEAYLIDQHAAHERLIYDKLKKAMEERKILRQGMLVPFAFAVNSGEKAFIDEHILTIRSLGFDIEPFGPLSYRVNEVPLDLKDINLQSFFNDLLAEINSLKEITLTDILKDKIATTACKHAVKGGMQLTQDEIDTLFKLMEGNVGLKCPHGRPVCV
ncbi:MAG: DNA mismatch repair endonuclease MutL, partial [Clostridia bacterium]|nr:DNA mismatch repair endonuclease MutL [Clostridia bacterium]